MEVIITTGTMIIRALWSLLTLGSFAAAITTLAPVRGSSTSIGTLVMASAAAARASFC